MLDLYGARVVGTVAGIIMSLAGSLLSNFGLQVQKVAYNKSEKEIHEGLEGDSRAPCTSAAPPAAHSPAGAAVGAQRSAQFSGR